MKRRIIEPWSFGSNTSPHWQLGENEIALMGHLDYCVTYRERSFRIWEPGRESFSSVGITDADSIAPELPLVATIHGMKGHIDFAFGMEDEALGQCFEDDGTEIPIENGLGGTTFVTPNNMWLALTGYSNAATGFPQSYSSASWVDVLQPFMRRAGSIRLPMFFSLYRGTYKQIDALSGAEIDSGPNDDPDTLLALDLTNPSVIESSRLDWWDLELYPLPRSVVSYNLTGDPLQMEGTYTTDNKGGFNRYPVNLQTNKTLGPDQVLWLHMRTGMIRLPVPVTDNEGTVTIRCIHYTSHQFMATMHASAMVTTRLAL